MKRIGIICLLLLLMLPMCVAAAGVPQGDYTVNDGERIAIPEAYTYKYTVNTVVDASGKRSFLDQPTDMFIDKAGYLYICDTKNDRVLKITAGGQIVQEYSAADGIPFCAPQGVFVDGDGTVYVADTDNARIVCFDASGTFVKSYGLPDSPMLSDVITYAPTKIGVTPAGAIYVLMGENIMLMDAGERFRGFIGQTDIGFDLLDWFLRRFASEEQKKSIEKHTAAPYDNFCVDDRGIIYAVGRDTQEGQIKALNTVGNNIYRKVGAVDSDWQTVKDAVSSYFSGNILSKAFMFGERYEGELPQFSDICVDADGIVTVIEKKSCHLFQYDPSGDLLAVFGGKGTNQGQFAMPVSVVTDADGRLYVLDQSYGTVTVLEPTAFIRSVQRATVAYGNGAYAEAEQLWNEVLSVGQTYPMAHYGAGCTAFKSGEWEKAMEHFRLSGDRKEYSKVFVEYRYAIVKANFWLVALAAVLGIGALTALLIWLCRRSGQVLNDFELLRVDRLGFGSGLLFGANILFRPGRMLDAVKYGRGRIRLSAPLFILACVFAVRLIFIFTVHYPMQDVEPDKANLALEFIKLLLPVLTWIGAVYLISAQFGGESTLTENFIAGAYAMIPYVLIELLAAGLSHVMCWNEQGAFALMVNGVTLWCVWLLLRAVRRLNDYSFVRTVGVALISVAAMVLIWFAALFAYSLVVCLIQFVQDIILELRLMQ